MRASYPPAEGALKANCGHGERNNHPTARRPTWEKRKRVCAERKQTKGRVGSSAPRRPDLGLHFMPRLRPRWVRHLRSRRDGYRQVTSADVTPEAWPSSVGRWSAFLYETYCVTPAPPFSWPICLATGRTEAARDVTPGGVTKHMYNMAAHPRRGRLKLQNKPSPELPQQQCDPPRVEEAENGRSGSNTNFGQKDLHSPLPSAPGFNPGTWRPHYN
ncbi:hypothetical protein PoB_007590500 [Plakobranchus ocellatus]|uniref:Uncharacterized protein n=1 Tax=Plakobranchus ocellatus TaxID=259542 RepID=A0AAV4DZF1_9GAST|nr:hypothetical protein PoB_007590500 [Plakobranchus ocellatus]